MIYQVEKDWHYRKEERRWVPMNDVSSWSPPEDEKLAGGASSGRSSTSADRLLSRPEPVSSRGRGRGPSLRALG